MTPIRQTLYLLVVIFFHHVAFGSETTITRVEDLLNRSDRIQGIEILVASAKDDEPASKFGHAMLRFVMKNGDPFEDPVVGFIAQVNDHTLSISKGLFGGYSAFFELNTLDSFFLSYISYQERPIKRYIIPTNHALRKNLVNILARWAFNPHEMGNYWFVGKNCTDLLLTFLQQGGVPTSNPPIAIPTLVGTSLTNNLITALPFIETQNPFLWRDKIRKQATSSFSKMKTEDLQVIFSILTRPEDIAVKSLVFEELKLRKNKKSLQDIYNLNPVSNEIYQLCLKDCDQLKFKQSIVSFLKNKNIGIIYENAMSLHRAWQISFNNNRKLNAKPYIYNFRVTQKIICDKYPEKTQDLLVPCYH